MIELISIPLKKPSDVDVIKPVTNVIKSTYNFEQNGKNFSEAINEFSKMRNNALWGAFEKHESSLECVYSYYDQLCALERKIPSHELKIPFKWKDAFDRTIFGGKLSLTISTISYEKMCVLFNIAALQSSIAASQSLENDEGLKLAAKLLQQSAGIFNYLKGNVMLAIQQEPTPDMSPETLGALSALMLAQAQEIFVHKAIYDSMKDGIIAKLAAQVEEFYAEALKLFQKEIFRSFWDKEWIHLMSGKQAGYHALAEFYQSLVCKTQKQVGMEIARLEYAVELFKIAQNRSNKSNLFQDYAIKAQKMFNDSKRDNDFIYHERIPDVKSLEPIGKACLAKLFPVPETFSSEFKDLFEQLLPVSVYHSISSYETRRSEVVNGEISKLREMTQILNGVLANLNLPAAIEDTSGIDVPQSLIDKAAFVKTEGGITALEAAMNELPELLKRNEDILNETERMLNEERESDEHLRTQFKERWTRIPSTRLTEQFVMNAQKYRGIINNAVSADKVIRTKFDNHHESMEILSLEENDLKEHIPAGTAIQESNVVRELRNLMEQVETLKAERDVIESELKSATSDMKSVFLSALVKDGVIDEPNLSVECIGKVYGPLQKQVRESANRQEELISQIQMEHEKFVSEQSGSGTAREETLCKLAAAFDSFKELRNNLKEGAKFYNDLTQLLVVFQNKISDFCFARKTEKEELFKDLTTNLGHSGPALTPAIPSHHEGPSSSESHTDSGLNLPYPLQYQGGMPIPHNISNATYQSYVAPPMPTTYNPYATMPYSIQGVYNFPQASSQIPYAGYATFPRNDGTQHLHGNNPWNRNG
ncbi:programmed cell death 6-interacting protein isoform X2 [Leptopilina boulardi]|uniref:programmed cell death 6-interacting protein isoform X1 n=2 Tax=Leptopilina boulardi TaxID=63433 RepID=UPI0021F53AD8|nr:programmed cell death 6-interacting protein isoform X1 [Leptopilina boulardi]XP_051162441.1 programmed cell death 6-interacting protein isoform X2 [Leptopilina boulardi]